MKKEQIIKESLSLFLKYGIKSITMDDVSRELGISKKTLYQVVSDKSELVDQTTKCFIENDRHAILDIINSYENVIEQLVQICNYCSDVLRNMNPAVIFDLNRYYPDVWKIYLA
ncbi:TetR/AcrR family transcriptional regulator, partial [Candidatus Amoebophilus asiaticus]|nr:TetR/AcrR family transcriptional regulator [Candidatus Amoebophilus asiaticus]